MFAAVAAALPLALALAVPDALPDGSALGSAPATLADGDADDDCDADRAEPVGGTSVEATMPTPSVPVERLLLPPAATTAAPATATKTSAAPITSVARPRALGGWACSGSPALKLASITVWT